MGGTACRRAALQRDHSRRDNPTGGRLAGEPRDPSGDRSRSSLRSADSPHRGRVVARGTGRR